MAKPLAKTVIVNILLNVITVGFYRFWDKTRIRNYIWSHLRFQGENFEYTGTGKELLFGFLIALLALAPVLIGFRVLSVANPNPPKRWRACSLMKLAMSSRRARCCAGLV